MSYILCIETGTEICSVGLVKNGELISLRESSEGRDHARRIAVFVDDVLRGTDIDAEELDAVAISKGPGSYTGLRIGTSFAKGLCYGLGIPLIAIGSLDSLVEVAADDNDAGILDIDDRANALLVPMIDARRMEVYTQVCDTHGNRLSEVEALIVDENTFAPYDDGKRELVLFGSGAAKCATVVPHAKVVEVIPSARGLARPAQAAFDRKAFEDVAYFEPFYLKDFVITQSKKKLF